MNYEEFKSKMRAEKAWSKYKAESFEDMRELLSAKPRSWLQKVYNAESTRLEDLFVARTKYFLATYSNPFSIAFIWKDEDISYWNKLIYKLGFKL